MVLGSLHSAPFKLLVESSLRNLTGRALFFVVLATARRVSNLQAVSRVVSFSGEFFFSALVSGQDEVSF